MRTQPIKLILILVESVVHVLLDPRGAVAAATETADVWMTGMGPTKAGLVERAAGREADT